MKYIFIPFQLIFRLYVAIVFFITLIVQYPIFYIFSRSERGQGALIFIHRYIWSKLMQLFTLVYVHRIKKITLPSGPCIICANHSSYYDIIFMYSAYKGKFLFMGKSELKKWPFLSVLFRNGNFHIAVNRKNPMEAAKSMKLAKKRLKEGTSIIIFPEGTIPENAPMLNKFKSGAFKLAVECQVPIVPVTFVDHWKLMGNCDSIIGPSRPGISRVIINNPIPTTGLNEKDVVNLQEMTHTIIENNLKKYVYPKLKAPIDGKKIEHNG